jgi:hypothetical protein
MIIRRSIEVLPGVAGIAALAMILVLAFQRPTDPGGNGPSDAPESSLEAVSATPTPFVEPTPAPAIPATPTPAPDTQPTAAPSASARPAMPPPEEVVAFTNPDGPDPGEYDAPDEYAFIALAQDLPTYANLWIDQNQRDAHIAVTRDIEGAIASLRDAIPRGITVYFHIARYTQSDLCGLQDRMFADREKLMRKGIVLMSGDCGSMDNRVSIGMSPSSPEAIDYMEARYPGPVDYTNGGGGYALRPFEPPTATDTELVAVRDVDELDLLTCGRKPFPASALAATPGDLNASGPEYAALRETLDVYRDVYGDLTGLGWILAETDDFGATFLANRGDTWLEAPAHAGTDQWAPGIIDYCAPRQLTEADGGYASVYLDPAFPKPSATDTEIHVLVEEEGCAGGGMPLGRLMPAIVDYSSRGVSVSIEVRSSGGIATCPSNQRMPVTVILPEPIGDRELLLAEPSSPF